jgi:hypothetical protein
VLTFLNERGQVSTQLSRCVRVTIGEVKRLVGFELTAETKLVVVATAARVLPLKVILPVLDLRTASFPLEKPIRLFLRNEHTHAIIEKRVRLGVIEDVEGVLLGLGRFYLIKEPLDVALSVGVILKNEIVFRF